MNDFRKYIDLISNKTNALNEKIRLFTKNIITEDFKDISIYADKKLNKIITEYLRALTPFEIISEEGEKNISYTEYLEPIWIVDPLDGSLNYSREIPISCISIGLWQKSELIGGIIYDFNHREIYTAVLDGVFTATVNNVDIHVSKIADIGRGIITTGFPSWRNYDTESLSKFIQNIQRWKKVRCIGSAALSLAWVACGKAEAYIEEDIRIWDVAAGLALVKAAGGEIYLKPNERPNFVTAIATNGKIPISQLLE